MTEMSKNLTNNYLRSIEQFELTCSRLRAVAEEHLRSPEEGQIGYADLCVQSQTLFHTLRPGFDGLSPAFKNRLRMIYGRLVSQFQTVCAEKDKAGADIEQMVLSTFKWTAAAKRLALREGRLYTKDIQAPPAPRKLFLGVSNLVERLLGETLNIETLDTALFSIMSVDNPLTPRSLGKDLFLKLANRPELLDAIVWRLKIAHKQNRIASISEESYDEERYHADFNALLSRHGLPPVQSSDYIYDFIEEGAGDRVDEWVAELYGFEVI